MTKVEREAKIAQLRRLAATLRANAFEGHMPYVTDAMDLIIDILDDDSAHPIDNPSQIIA